jgi:hypothetical protein
MTKKERAVELQKTIDRERAKAIKGGLQEHNNYYAYIYGVLSATVSDLLGEKIDTDLKYRVNDDGSFKWYF